MITTQRLIACWIALGLALLGGNHAHDALQKEAVVIAAKEAPPYVSVSDVEAVRLRYEACKRDLSFEVMLFEAGSSCQEHFSKPVNEIAEDAQEIHRASYVEREVKSRVDARQSELRKNLETFYYGLIIAASAAFLLWCKSTVFPRLVALKNAIYEHAPSAKNLKALGANRKVRQAESEFVTLKNLHDNGLINDEMFEKRKEVLKASLSGNQVFQD